MHIASIETAADVSLVAATAKTLLQAVTGATRRLKLLEAGVSGASVATNPPDTPMLIEIREQSTAGTSSANTPIVLDRQDPAAIYTALDTFTAEPTDVGLRGPGIWRISPSGIWVYQIPWGQELVMQISTRMGLRLTAPNAESNVRAYMVWQE